ncbi:MAG: type I-MYXAN CRISPR-associated protein Cmx8 [Waddliaceae bacterium]
MSDNGIELTYDPFTLPTVQHRAGLAGLLVLIESLRRRKIKSLPETSQTNDGRFLIRLKKESLNLLFNDLYDTVTLEIESDKKRKDKKKREIPPLREEKKTNPKTGKQKTMYIYPQLLPKGCFLSTFNMPDIWLKLWQDAIWGTLRDRPTTRKPYQQRESNEPLSEVEKVWKDLETFQQKQVKNKIHTVEIASSIFVGAQSQNAEHIPFRGRADEAFLLYFWPVVMGVYVPEVIDIEGKTKFSGYVLTVPDVSDLFGFIEDFPEIIHSLGETAAGYRPRGAVISIPQEGGLEYIHHLTDLAKGKFQSGNIGYSITGVEVYHLKKRGNNVILRMADRITASRVLLEKYEAIRNQYYNPIFKRQIILNLLRGEPWYRRFDRTFSKNKYERFIGSQTRQFSRDVRHCFTNSLQERRVK